MNKITLKRDLPKKQVKRPAITNTTKRAHLLFSIADHKADILPFEHAAYDFNEIFGGVDPSSKPVTIGLSAV